MSVEEAARLTCIFCHSFNYKTRVAFICKCVVDLIKVNILLQVFTIVFLLLKLLMTIAAFLQVLMLFEIHVLYYLPFDVVGAIISSNLNHFLLF